MWIYYKLLAVSCVILVKSRCFPTTVGRLYGLLPSAIRCPSSKSLSTTAVMFSFCCGLSCQKNNNAMIKMKFWNWHRNLCIYLSSWLHTTILLKCYSLLHVTLIYLPLYHMIRIIYAQWVAWISMIWIKKKRVQKYSTKCTCIYIYIW